MRTSLSKGSDLPLIGAITLITIIAGQNPNCNGRTTSTINSPTPQQPDHLAIRDEAIKAWQAQMRLTLRNAFGEIKL